MSSTISSTIYDKHAKTICANFDQAIKKTSKAQLGVCMLEKFFLRYPEARGLFVGVDIPDFAASKFRIVSEQIIDSVKRPEHATYNMFCEIHRHAYLEIHDADYHYALIETCREAVEEALADEWTPEINEYWNDVVQSAKSVVQRAWLDASSEQASNKWQSY
jgi:acetoin utilization deacetylase AcuC-like enzyme